MTGPVQRTGLDEGGIDWVWDITTDIVSWSEQHYRTAGYDPGLRLPPMREHSRFYTSESWCRLIAAILQVLTTGASYEIELQMVQPDGTTRWVVSTGEAVRDVSNRILHLHGSVEDITERKRWQVAQKQSATAASTDIHRSWINGLIDAYEDEKACASRKLTDEICQSLALLAVKIQQLRSASPQFTTQEHLRIEELWQHAEKATAKVYRLAQELYPSTLDLIGLAEAIRGLCRDQSNRLKIHIECVASLHAEIDKRLSLGFFRICQQALRHISKCSRPKNVSVELGSSGNELLLHITVEGDGGKFDWEEANRPTELWFVSMQEQLRLIGGELVVCSYPSFSAHLEARAPLTEFLGNSSAA